MSHRLDPPPRPPQPRRKPFRVLNATTIGAGVGCLLGVAVALLFFVLPAARGEDGRSSEDIFTGALLGTACLGVVLASMGAAGGWLIDAAILASREAKTMVDDRGERDVGAAPAIDQILARKRAKRRANPRAD